MPLYKIAHTKPRTNIPCPLTTLMLFLLLSLPSTVISKTYKYQDSNGRWHYTDKAPRHSQEAQIVAINSSNSTTINFDLITALNKKYQSTEPEKAATLAVIQIKSTAGVGSGFFVNNQGFIVTNKHVVKPSESTLWNKYEEQIAQQEKQLSIAANNLNHRSTYHKKLYNSLLEYEKAIKGYWDRSSKKILKARYKILANNFTESKRQLSIAKSNYASIAGQLNKFKKNLSRKKSKSYWAHKFKIKLKDGTELYAKYIGASKKLDLAFLKLEGYKTPFLITAEQTTNIQGSTVFAIGSPLGVSDSLTSGIVTNVQNDYIYTNTSVFPGNSGGPLIDKSGKVLGVITQKVTPGNVMSKGFGKAIPIKQVEHELKTFL